MSAQEDRSFKNIQWRGDIGPAFLAILIQTLVLFGGGIAVYTRLSDTVDVTKNQIIELKNVTNTLKDTQFASQERVAKVETSLNFVASSLDRLDKKLDQITIKP